TGSRGGLIALAAEVAISSLLLRRRWPMGRTGRPTAWLGLAAAAAATVLGAALLFSWVDSGWASKRLGLLVNVRSPNWVDKSRMAWTLDSLRMLRDHPALGVGLGAFGVAYPGYQSVPGDLWLDHAHDDYAEVIAETGLVGAALIVSALWLFVRLAFTGMGKSEVGSRGTEFGSRESEVGESSDSGFPEFRVPSSEFRLLVRLGAAIGCCGLLVHSFFDFNLHIPANAAWFAVL